MTAILGVDSEVPLRSPVPATPYWSENYAMWACDPAHGVTIHFHLSRTNRDEALWREVVGVYFGDGEVLVSKGYAASSDPRGPASAGLRLTCEEPSRWTARFHGAARRTTAAETDTGPLADGFWEPLVVELEWQGIGPALVYTDDDIKGQEWGDAHYDQPGRARGRLVVGGRVLEIDAFSYRDHSRGPREFSALDSGTFTHGCFPSGRAFVASEVAGGRWAAIYGDGSLERVELLAGPPLRPGSPLDRFDVRLQSRAGNVTVATEPLSAIRFTIMAPNEFVCGRMAGGLAWYECPVRCEWDGEVGWGTSERVYRETPSTRTSPGGG